MANSYERRARQLNRFLDALPRRMHEKFRETTPRRTGNAQSKTELRGTDIVADYPYAVRLEKEGWSRQAPEGMSEPTIEWVRSELRKL